MSQKVSCKQPKTHNKPPRIKPALMILLMAFGGFLVQRTFHIAVDK